MAKERRNVVFRRIRGRIVPIRIKPGDKNRKQVRLGAGLIAAGTVVSATGGAVALGFSKRSIKAQQSAFRFQKLARKASQRAQSGQQLNMFRQVTNLGRVKTLLGRSRKAKKASSILTKFAARTKGAALLGGATLLGTGIQSILNATDKSPSVEAKIGQDFASGIAGDVASVAFAIGIGRFAVGTRVAGALNKSVRSLTKAKIKFKTRIIKFDKFGQQSFRGI